MSVSEQMKNVHFSKALSGYSVKEVDAFFEELLSQVQADEQQLRTQAAQLDAWDARAREIRNAREEAQAQLAAAKTQAEKLLAEAQTQAQAILAEAEAKAAAREEKARQNAAAILFAADGRGREILASAQTQAEAVRADAARLSAQAKDFETRFCALLSDTAAQVRETVASAPTVPAEPERKTEEKQTPASPENLPKKTQDFTFAGGHPIRQPDAGTKRTLYDTVQVTYDTQADDGYADVQKLLENRGERRVPDPTRFME